MHNIIFCIDVDLTLIIEELTPRTSEFEDINQELLKQRQRGISVLGGSDYGIMYINIQ